MHASTQIHRTFLQLLYWFVTFFFITLFATFLWYSLLQLSRVLPAQFASYFSFGSSQFWRGCCIYITSVRVICWWLLFIFLWSWCCFLARHSMWVIIFETLLSLSLCVTTTFSPHTIALRYFLWFSVSIFVLHCLVLLLLSILQLAWFVPP